MLYTTFALAHKAGACTESYKKMAKALGGITKYGRNTPVPLDKVTEVCGLQDTIWACLCTTENSENFLIEFSCRCAEHVLHFYEGKYPNDKRPRKSIEAARVCISDKSAAAWAAAGAAAWDARAAARAAAGDARAAARAAAGDAARAAAGDAAWDARAAARDAARAAWDAAGDAEKEWQKAQFLELLNDRELAQ